MPTGYAAGMTEPEKSRRLVGVIGLGLMGTAITGRLLELGFLPVVWNRSPDKALPLVAQGARWSDNPLAECDRVIISLFTSDIVAEVLEQMGSALRAGHYLIDTTTGEPDVVLRLGQRLASRGVH